MNKINNDRQAANIEFFQKNLGTYLNDQLLRDKFLVISDKSIKGQFDNFENALTYAVTQKLEAGEFIIQQVIDEREIINFLGIAI